MEESYALRLELLQRLYSALRPELMIDTLEKKLLQISVSAVGVFWVKAHDASSFTPISFIEVATPELIIFELKELFFESMMETPGPHGPIFYISYGSIASAAQQAFGRSAAA